MNKTSYGLELRKPSYTDEAEIGDLNYNMDIIDHAIKELTDRITALTERVAALESSRYTRW